MGMGYFNEIEKTIIDFHFTADDLKHQLNVDPSFTDDDYLIDSKIKAAYGLAEDVTGTDISLKDAVIEAVDFCGDSLVVNEYPFNSLTSIRYIDDEGNEVDYDISKVTVRRKRTSFELKLDDTITSKNVKFRFILGYDLDKLPDQIREAIFLKVTDLYDIERSSFVTGVNFKDTGSFKRWLHQYIISRW